VEADRPAIEAALDAWLAPFLDVMGRVTRRRWAPLYLHGLIGPDGRKSLQPLAARLGLGGHDQLQLDLLPESGGVRSERHAAAGMTIASMSALASAGVR
jgi:SRSO17 transposase